MNRRTFAISGISVAALAGRFASAQESTPTDSGWTFTDDKGVTVTLDKTPEVLLMDVNVAAPLWDFGIKPSGLFGWNVLADGKIGTAGGNVDGTDIPLAGNVNEPFQIEEAISIDPDLILTLTWEPGAPDDYWSINAELLNQVREVAPLLALSATGRADVNLGRFAELAEALGADLSSAELVQARADYEQALADFTAAASESDLVALFVSIGESGTVVANPPDWGDLNMYTELGLTTVEPGVEPYDYWLEISNELANDFPADLLFVSSRDGRFSNEEIQAMPGWGKHPAVIAGQIFDWNQDFIQSYQGMKAALDVVTGAIISSTKVI